MTWWYINKYHNSTFRLLYDSIRHNCMTMKLIQNIFFICGHHTNVNVLKWRITCRHTTSFIISCMNFLITIEWNLHRHKQWRYKLNLSQCWLKRTSVSRHFAAREILFQPFAKNGHWKLVALGEETALQSMYVLIVFVCELMKLFSIVGIEQVG